MSLILLSNAADPFIARDAAGRPLPFATLDFYRAGTSQPAELGDDHGHFEADANGVFPAIELEISDSYRVVHKTREGVLIYDVDPYLCTCGESITPVFRSPSNRAFDGAGAIAPGALLYSFEDDGETPIALYADPELVTPLPNPVVANAAGAFPPIYSNDDATYVLELHDADGNLLEQFDPYVCACGVPAPPFPIVIKAALGSYTPNGEAHFTARGYQNGFGNQLGELQGGGWPDDEGFFVGFLSLDNNFRIIVSTAEQLSQFVPFTAIYIQELDETYTFASGFINEKSWIWAQQTPFIPGNTYTVELIP